MLAAIGVRKDFDDLVEAITSRKTDTILIDIRPELQYSKKHIRHAINLVPKSYESNDVNEFIKTLRKLKLHLLVKYVTSMYKKEHQLSKKTKNLSSIQY